MPIKADYHLHSNFSGDSTADMEAMIHSAVDQGLTHMCFTEHHDIDFVYEDGGEPIFLLNTDSYLYDLIRYKEKYADKLNILFGVELGVQPHILKELTSYTQSFDFDFIIASSHISQRKDPYYPSFYEGRTDWDAYFEYFLSVLENVRNFTDYDVYGHLDYVVRYGKHKNEQYSYLKFADIIDEVLKTIIANGKGIELNTGGFRAGLGEPNPSFDIIKRYHEFGGELITVGSDAHNPAAVAEHFNKATDILKAAGYQYYCIYKNRLPEYQLL